MKRTLIVLLSSLATLVLGINVAAAQAHVVNITGYPIGEFAVKGSVQQQLDARVIGPIESALSRAKSGEEISISIAGYADHTGSGSENDEIALKRASQVEQVLLGKFPNAHITMVSKGNDADLRIVVVMWKLTAPATHQSPKPPETNEQWRWILAILAILFIFGVTIFIYTRKGSDVPAAPTMADEKAFDEKRYEREGKFYVVPFHLKDGEWETPFRNKNDRNTFNRRKELADAQKVADLFMGKLFNTADVQDMIRNGTIREGDL
jgi:hypothetical protein